MAYKTFSSENLRYLSPSIICDPNSNQFDETNCPPAKNIYFVGINGIERACAYNKLTGDLILTMKHGITCQERIDVKAYEHVEMLNGFAHGMVSAAILLGVIYISGRRINKFLKRKFRIT